MVQITTASVVLVFVLLLVISIVAAFAVNPRSFESSRWRTFVVTFASMSLVATILFYYNVVGLQQSQQTLNIIQETRNIKEEIVETTIKEIKEYNQVIPEFVASLYPLTVNSKHTQYNTKYDTNIQEEEIFKTTLSMRLFRSWETVVLSKNMIGSKDHYLVCFLQWASSHQLREMWEKLKINYTKHAGILGDMLFKYGLRIKKQCPDSYLRKLEKMKNDNDYKLIFC